MDDPELYQYKIKQIREKSIADLDLSLRFTEEEYDVVSSYSVWLIEIRHTFNFKISWNFLYSVCPKFYIVWKYIYSMLIELPQLFSRSVMACILSHLRLQTLTVLVFLVHMYSSTCLIPCCCHLGILVIFLCCRVEASIHSSILILLDFVWEKELVILSCWLRMGERRFCVVIGSACKVGRTNSVQSRECEVSGTECYSGFECNLCISLFCLFDWGSHQVWNGYQKLSA